MVYFSRSINSSLIFSVEYPVHIANRNKDIKTAGAGAALNDMVSKEDNDDYKTLVEQAYDQMASNYLDWTSKHSPIRNKHLQKLLDRLPKHSKVLELGCGAGVPCTQILTQHAQVTANDILKDQIALAKQRVPEAELIQGDMMALKFAPDAFHAVVAFYSIIHLPRTEQEVLIRRLSE